MGMSKTKRNFLWQSTLLIVLVGVGGAGLLFSFCPQHYFRGYPLIPVYFWLGGILQINIVERCRRRMPEHVLQVYLLLRVLRMVVSVFLALIYCILVREEAKAFLLTFIANYLIYLSYDTWFFFTAEGNRDIRKKKDELIA